MAIWFRDYSLEDLNAMNKNNMAEFIGIEFTAIGEDFLEATMPVNEKTVQPMGILHGGASVALAETLGSIAANLVVDREKFYCVGLDINANHLRAGRGKVTGITRPVHLGKSTQVWSIEIFNEEKKPVCISRITMAVLSRNKV